jgi:hypothetical protein
MRKQMGFSPTLIIAPGFIPGNEKKENKWALAQKNGPL